jgi:membrane protein DedA with SNARE-associated domain
MHAVIEFLHKYGYWVLFFNVLVEQIGIPLPTMPVFLAMGALAGLGDFSFGAAVIISLCATMIADLTWYHLGRTRGTSILNLLCRISLEPDSCVSNTKNQFQKRGAYSLLFAKFVPGLSAVAPPLAGLTRIPLRRFVVFDVLGVLAWCTSYLLAGYIFKDQLEDVAETLSNYGGRVGILALLLLAAYIAWKYYQRQRFIRELRMDRITPKELVDMITAGEDVAIVDLRNALELAFDGTKLPGAIWIDLQDLDNRHEEIPREKEVVVYCS